MNVNEITMREITQDAVQVLKNHASNSKAAFLKLQRGEKMSEGERLQAVSFYLETLAQMERLAE